MKSELLAPSKWPVWALLLSAAMLAVAHAFEHFAMLAPCPLCLRQREVYWAAIALAVVGLAAIRWMNNPRTTLTVNMLLCLVFLTGAVIAGYHAGVEWKLWAGPTECSGSARDAISALDDIDLDRKFATVSCSEAAWRMFGISMAGYNAMLSIGLAIISAIFAGMAVQKPSREDLDGLA